MKLVKYQRHQLARKTTYTIELNQVEFDNFHNAISIATKSKDHLDSPLFMKELAKLNKNMWTIIHRCPD